MKRVAAPIIFLLALLFSATALARDLPDPNKVPFDEAVEQLNTPQKVNSWIRKYMTYDTTRAKEVIELGKDAMKRGLKGDALHDFKWKHIHFPSETYAKRGGVCFDIANFATYCLNQAGYDAMIVGYRFKRTAKTGAPTHAACVCQADDGWYVVANATSRGIDPLDGPYPKLANVFNHPLFGSSLGIKCVFNTYAKTEGQTVREQYHEWSMKDFCKLYDLEK